MGFDQNLNDNSQYILYSNFFVFSQFFGEPIACDAGEVSKDFKVRAERHLSLSRSIVINAIPSSQYLKTNDAKF